MGQRHESPDFYEQGLAVLERSPTEQVAANEAFGDPTYTGQKGVPSRSAALDAQHAVALVREGAVPLAKSRPLSDLEFGHRGPAAAPVPARSLSSDR